MNEEGMLTEVKGLTQECSAGQWQSCFLKPDPTGSEAQDLSTSPFFLQ